jgi:hypothetical protein
MPKRERRGEPGRETKAEYQRARDRLEELGSEVARLRLEWREKVLEF